MLRITASTSAASAKSYYSRDDYYGTGESLVGEWIGRGAELLGLSGAVRAHDFRELCDNRHPESGARITAKTKRDRRPGYDFTFDVPKSLSILHALCGDERILGAMDWSVRKTISEIEKEIHVRVRAGGADFDRPTGNLVAAPFTHFTARPVDGWADPHLHQHVFALNMSHDAVEGKWKAGQFGTIKERGPYFQALYHHELVSNLARIGYQVDSREGRLEVQGFPTTAIRKLSRRTEQIREIADELQIVDADEKAALGAKSRKGKKGGLKGPELVDRWKSVLTAEELQNIDSIAAQARNGPVEIERADPKDILQYAVGHVFERASAVEIHELLGCALEHAAGQVNREELQAAIEKTPEIITEEWEGETWVTTRQVLEEEYENIQYVKSTRGSLVPINQFPDIPEEEKLSTEQVRAVEHILTSADRVTAVSGGPGTGKTTLMKTAVAAINASGLRVYTFAPSAEASRKVLRDEGFPDADTLHQLLQNPTLQEKVIGQVVWVDEAGLIGANHMNQLLNLAKKLNFRVILGGDTSQHSPTPRGDALRILEEHAGMKHVRVRTIRRQKTERYRTAVQHISDREVGEGFKILDDLGWIRQISGDKRHLTLAEEYVASVHSGQSALIVAPTHAEGAKISRAVRRKLKDANLLNGVEAHLPRLKNNGWTEAQRAVPGKYAFGLVVQFHQNSRGNLFSRGERATVLSVTDKFVMVRSNTGISKRLPLNEAAKFAAYDVEPLPVAVGEQLRITANGTAKCGARLNNGAIYRVEEILSNGDLRMANGVIIGGDYGHLTHGYCGTSVSSQGKTVDHVLVGQSAESLGRASSLEQFNVSVSRGKYKVTIFTDDKEQLLRSVTKSSARLSAHDVVPRNRMHLVLNASRARQAVLGHTALLHEKAPHHELSRPRVASPDFDHEPSI